MVRCHLEPGAQVLDWGTACGHFSYFLTHAGYRATGFDFEDVSQAGWLDEPYERHVVGGSPADPVHLPFADAAFDAVASVGVLEHVRETGGTEAASLSEIRRVLRPGGLFLCFHFPNRNSWIEFLTGFVPGKHYHHAYRYVRSDIERLTAQSGLELLEVERYGILPRNILRRLPGPLRHARWVADLWGTADAVAGVALSPLCQNYAFVARRPDR
jgi:cyclopropane fatty-acyl-phospholipid synthase-like methyltransferase